MDILHILRSVPDAAIEKMMAELSNSGRANIIKLYEADIDWENVVDAIFSHNRVICWW